MASTKVIDKGFTQIIKRTNALGRSGVRVGLLDGKTPRDVLDIGIYNEWGTRHIPARSFIRDAAVKYAHDVAIIMQHLARKVQDGASPQDALRTLGERYQAMQQAHIRSGEFAPNAPSTIERKGSSVPLVDQGRILVPNIRYVVEK